MQLYAGARHRRDLLLQRGLTDTITSRGK